MLKSLPPALHPTRLPHPHPQSPRAAKTREVRTQGVEASIWKRDVPVPEDPVPCSPQGPQGPPHPDAPSSPLLGKPSLSHAPHPHPHHHHHCKQAEMQHCHVQTIPCAVMQSSFSSPFRSFPVLHCNFPRASRRPIQVFWPHLKRIIPFTLYVPVDLQISFSIFRKILVASRWSCYTGIGSVMGSW